MAGSALHREVCSWNQIESWHPIQVTFGSDRSDACNPADFFGDKAIERSNDSVPSRLFLDPYHTADGNLIGQNFLMGRFQRGGQTCLAARSKMLVMEKERLGKTDMQSRARSKYLEPEGGRFVPPLKPACSRDKGPVRAMCHPNPHQPKSLLKRAEAL